MEVAMVRCTMNKDTTVHLKSICLILLAFVVSYQYVSAYITSDILNSEADRGQDFYFDMKSSEINQNRRHHFAVTNNNPFRRISLCQVTVPVIESEMSLLKRQIEETERRRAQQVKIHFETYANEIFSKYGKRIAREPKNFERFANVTVYKPENIDAVSDSISKRFCQGDVAVDSGYGKYM